MMHQEFLQPLLSRATVRGRLNQKGVSSNLQYAINDCFEWSIITFRRINLFLDKSGWNKRIENNGWRLVSDRLITNILSDPVTWETSRKPVEFSHNKVNYY